MSKFVLKLLLFLALFVIVDHILGKGINLLSIYAKGGDTAKNVHITRFLDEDVLILGSSRASNHYVPDSLEHHLGLSTYNCGQNENGIILFYPLMNLIKQRHKPKMLIYDVYTMDLLDGMRFNGIDYLTILKPVYGVECVDSMFHRAEYNSKIKMHSRLYRHNSTFLNLIIDVVKNRDIYHKGFYQLNTGILQNPSVSLSSKHDFVYDPEKLSFLEKFIVENKDSVKLIFAISPEYGKIDDIMFEPLKMLCNTYNIPLLNHYCDTTFTYHKELFSNQNHLNHKGANLYSSIISKELEEQ